MLVYDALRRSYNTIAVWIGSYVGAEELFSFAHDTLNCAYLDPEHDVDLAPLVLGSQSQGLTVVELAGAYSIFNDGKFTTQHYWTEIYDSDRYHHEPSAEQRVEKARYGKRHEAGNRRH